MASRSTGCLLTGSGDEPPTFGTPLQRNLYTLRPHPTSELQTIPSFSLEKLSQCSLLLSVGRYSQMMLNRRKLTFLPDKLVAMGGISRHKKMILDYTYIVVCG